MKSPEWAEEENKNGKQRPKQNIDLIYKLA